MGVIWFLDFIFGLWQRVIENRGRMFGNLGYRVLIFFICRQKVQEFRGREY